MSGPGENVLPFPVNPREVLDMLRGMVPTSPSKEDEERRLWDQVVQTRMATFGIGGAIPKIEDAVADADAVIAARRKTFP